MSNLRPVLRKLFNSVLLWYCRLVVGVLAFTVVSILASLLYLSSGLLTRTEILVPVVLPDNLTASVQDYQDAVANGEQQLASEYLVSKSGSYQLRNYLAKHPDQAGTEQEVWLTLAAGEVSSKLVAELEEDGRIRTKFSLHFLTNDDSRSPQQAGIRGSLVGSLLIVFMTALFAVPVGCASAIYLAEFAPHGKFRHTLEILINNLAAVPSIVFGLLGLAIFIEFFQLPRASALVAGLVLGIMILPIIVVSAKLALQNVPNSLREAALSVGASHLAAVFHHVVPAALPGMLNGISIALIRALGETAPLLVIGMAGFIAGSPNSFVAASSALPMQIYTWAVSPEPAFVQLAAGAVLVLVTISILIHFLALFLKNRFSRR